jgi:hypothetical protein
MSSAPRVDKFSPPMILMNNYRRGGGNVLHENMDILLEDPDDATSKWLVRVRDIDGKVGEFTGGEYIVELTPQADPLKHPPMFKFLTPNGLYKLGSDEVCISIGRFHKENYAPAQGGMTGFCKQMIDILVSWRDMTAGASFLHNDYFRATSALAHMPAAERLSRIAKLEEPICESLLKFAGSSREYNRKNYKDLIERFENKPLNQLHRAVREAKKIYAPLRKEMLSILIG